MDKSRKGKITIYNPSTKHTTYINKDDFSIYEKKGYIKGRGSLSEEHKKKIGLANKGKSNSLKGVPRSDITKQKISNQLKGKKHSTSRRKQNSECHKGIKWYNDGVHEKQSFECPGQSWSRGRLPHSELSKQRMSESHKKIKLTKEQLEIRASKEYLTKKKNNSFNSSKDEEKLYEELLIKYADKTVLRRYKCERYPFYCDFYIPSEDLFIELNAHWTHGGKPYDPKDKECQEQLAKWKEKAKTSKFYENAIKTWTERDVKKLQTAKENNLNYRVIY